MPPANKKNRSSPILDILPQAINAFQKNIIEPFIGNGKPSADRNPLRAELFTIGQLEQHAISIANRHNVFTKHPTEQLLKRLAENEKILLEVHQLLSETVKNNHRVVPAAEWLLDNFY